VQRLSAFPSPDSAALARRLGVRDVVVHSDRLRTRETAEAAQRRYDFILRATIGADELFEVSPDESAGR